MRFTWRRTVNGLITTPVEATRWEPPSTEDTITAMKSRRSFAAAFMVLRAAVAASFPGNGPSSTESP